MQNDLTNNGDGKIERFTLGQKVVRPPWRFIDRPFELVVKQRGKNGGCFKLYVDSHQYIPARI